MAKVTEYTRSNVVDYVADKCGLTKAAAEEAVKKTMDGIQHLLLEGSKGTDGAKISLRGFGTFSTSRTSARNGRNPQTGEVVKIAASRRAAFSPSKDFKEALKAVK